MARRRDYFRHTALISALTLVSRVLGLVRNVACAAIFGADVVWDAFSFAWRVPNLFRRLFGEGALASALIPIFTEYLEQRGRERAWRLAWNVATAAALVLLACLLLGESLALAIPRLVDLSGRWRLALALTAVLLPYMLFICLTALAGSVLQSLKRFAAPALAPVVLNVCWIVALLVVAPVVSRTLAGRAFIVAVGILAAGGLQLALQLFALRRERMPWRPTLDLSDPGLRRVARTMAPVMVGMAAFQLNVLLDGVIAISLSAPEGRETFRLLGSEFAYPMRIGAQSVLWYADRLMQFPLGVFGIALATAIFPALSSHAARGDTEGYRETLTDAVGAVLFIGIPAGVGLIVVGKPAVQLLYERWRFGADDTLRTAAVLAAYSTGIWAYCALHVLTRAFYSLQDTLTPVKVAAGMVALNLVLNLTLIWWVGVAGLALATAISASVQCALLYVILRRRAGPPAELRLLRTLLKTLLATLGMVGACTLALAALPPAPIGDVVWLKLLRAFVPVIVGGALYLLLAAALRVPEMEVFAEALRRRLKRRGTDPDA